MHNTRAAAYPLITGALAATLLATAVPALAEWVVRARPGGASGAAGVLPRTGQPTGTAAGRAVAVSWPPSFARPGLPVAGYRVTRYGPAGRPSAPGGSCAGVVRATRCLDPGAGPGRWRYAVQAVHGARWVGPPSMPSAAVPVDGYGPGGPVGRNAARTEATQSGASDPATDDPAANDPAANDPAANDPAANDPDGADSAGRDPNGGDPNGDDPDSDPIGDPAGGPTPEVGPALPTPAAGASPAASPTG
jgi:hypothetical protein